MHLTRKDGEKRSARDHRDVTGNRIYLLGLDYPTPESNEKNKRG